jgi:hypothetical protein
MEKFCYCVQKMAVHILHNSSIKIIVWYLRGVSDCYPIKYSKQLKNKILDEYRIKYIEKNTITKNKLKVDTHFFSE